MLNNKIVAATAALLVATAGVANANAFDNVRFNLGGELSLLNKTSYNSANTQDLNNFKTSNTADKLAIQKNKMGVNLFLGTRFHQNFGAELGYGVIAKAKAAVQGNRTATNKVRNIYVDLLGYLPVAHKVDLVGALGVGALKSKAAVPGATFSNLNALNKNKVGYRVGAGAQYNITDNWSTRAMVRYQKGNKNFLKSNVSVSLGGAYTF